MKIFSLQYLNNKLKEKGIVYCITMGSHFFFIIYPMMVLKLLFRSIGKKLWMCIDSIKYGRKKNSETLYAFYDLAVAPATFDIIYFLVLAEHMRIQKQCKNLHVVIVPGTETGFRPDDLKGYQERSIDQKNANLGYMEWRLRNILIPSCWLIPSCKGITVCTSRNEAQAFEISFAVHYFPSDHFVRSPKKGYELSGIILIGKTGGLVPTISSPEHALKFIEEWLDMHTGKRKTIVITLRESTYQLDRNSNLSGWGKFVQNLDTSVFCPVIIRDTEKAFELLPPEFEKALIFPEACFNLELRSALYELCYLNMITSGGPLALCMFNKKIKYIVFKLLSPSFTNSFFQSQGLEPGTQPEFCGPFQKWVWKDDTYDIIMEEFLEMAEKIDNSAKNIE